MCAILSGICVRRRQRATHEPGSPPPRNGHAAQPARPRTHQDLLKLLRDVRGPVWDVEVAYHKHQLRRGGRYNAANTPVSVGNVRGVSRRTCAAHTPHPAARARWRLIGIAYSTCAATTRATVPQKSVACSGRHVRVPSQKHGRTSPKSAAMVADTGLACTQRSCGVTLTPHTCVGPQIQGEDKPPSQGTGRGICLPCRPAGSVAAHG